MKSIVICLLAFVCSSVQAQHTTFLQQGRIEFEKKQNVHARIDEMYGDDNASWKDLEKKMTPKFSTSYFDLQFTGNITSYKPGRELQENVNVRESPAEANEVYTDLQKKESISQKKVFEQLYLQQDSIRRIRWKLTDETRKIAGFDCRRANAIIMDSIYVVAFYTDAIVTPGGPESFTGLPGMILGVALPHEHITWFATKVLVDDVQPGALKPPARGKKVTTAALNETISKTLDKWGNYGKAYLKGIML
ncbi:GLPGLI family protein [Chitinophaga solisilvae]|uniref:GLPGLI family protein n=1 Tax=Chitinophaga solisilvae TaxID=1233460 RepID=UPI001371493F|nr:GLPGLI family protein [Chitinophaga solisilvae]